MNEKFQHLFEYRYIATTFERKLNMVFIRSDVLMLPFDSKGSHVGCVDLWKIINDLAQNSQQFSNKQLHPQFSSISEKIIKIMGHGFCLSIEN